MVIGAAWLGARYGSRASTQGALEALKHEAMIERNTRLNQLNRRIDQCCDAVDRIVVKLVDVKAEHGVAPAAYLEMINVWERYDRLSDWSVYYPDRLLLSDIETFFRDVCATGEHLRATEDRHIQEMITSPTRPGPGRAVILRGGDVIRARKESLKRITLWPNMVAALRDRHAAHSASTK